jgi:5-methylcytosine-specific restriction endonuclease McrA
MTAASWARAQMHSRRQRRRYFWCRQPMARQPGLPNSPTLDHLVPRSRGGIGLRDNLTASSKRCSEARGTMHPSKFLGALIRQHCDTMPV